MGRKKIIGKCALCLQNKSLCNSHIIPEFCFKPTYDNKHRSTLMRSKIPNNCFVQKGIRCRLLCENCEELLNEHEKYFKSFWFDQKALPTRVPTGLVEIIGIDYTHFKLFHLSVLWRASVAQIKPFSTVFLGPYEDKLRQRILACDPGDEELYSFLGVVIANPDRSVCYGLVSGPCKSRLDNFTVYYMCYAGCEWTFIVTDHDCDEYKYATIRQNKVFTLATRPLENLNTIKGYLER